MLWCLILMFVLLPGVPASVKPRPLLRAATVPVTECPSVILLRVGGLGTEAHGGVVAAVWASGVMLRAESRERPSGPHVVGELAENDLRALLETIHNDRIWTLRSGGLAVDLPQDELILQRDADRIGWAETPGVTATRALARVRNLLFTARIRGAHRVAGPIEEAWKCQAVTWAP